MGVSTPFSRMLARNSLSSGAVVRTFASTITVVGSTCSMVPVVVLVSVISFFSL